MLNKKIFNILYGSSINCAIASDSKRNSGTKTVSTALMACLLASAATGAKAEPDDVKRLEAQLNKLTAEMKLVRAQLKKQPREPSEVRIKEAAKTSQAAQEPISKEPLPSLWDKKFHFGPVTITPGGFFAGEGVWRQHAQQSDIASSFGALPFPNNPQYHMAETRFSGRQSRVALLAEAPFSPDAIASGYFEMDFLGAAHTANNVESSSYNPRIRNLYAALDWNDPGIHILAGEAWSMLTLNGKGIIPRTEVFPPFIDADLIPGQPWERGAQVRFVKDFGKSFWIGLSLENPQTTFSSCPGTPTAAGANNYNSPTTGYGQLPSGVDVYCQSPGGLFYDALNNYSFNRLPDIIGKVAWDGSVAEHNVHLEASGLFTEFYDRVAYGGTANAATGLVSGYTASGNATTAGWGASAGLVAQIIPKRLDLLFQVMGGRGIGRYGSSLLPDATFNPNGSIAAIPEAMMVSNLVLHATPTLDLWAYGGFEREFGQYFAYGPNSFYGVGVPNANNTGCSIEGSTLCTGATRQVWQVSGGFWDKIYEGPYGSVRFGLQYSYTQRELFAGNGGLPAGGGSLGAKTSDNIVLSSLRFYPF